MPQSQLLEVWTSAFYFIISMIDFFHLVGGVTLHLLTHIGHTVGMIFHCHLTISFAYIIVRGVRCDTKDTVGILAIA